MRLPYGVLGCLWLASCALGLLGLGVVVRVLGWRWPLPAVALWPALGLWGAGPLRGGLVPLPSCCLPCGPFPPPSPSPALPLPSRGAGGLWPPGGLPLGPGSPLGGGVTLVPQHMGSSPRPGGAAAITPMEWGVSAVGVAWCRSCLPWWSGAWGLCRGLAGLVPWGVPVVFPWRRRLGGGPPGLGPLWLLGRWLRCGSLLGGRALVGPSGRWGSSGLSPVGPGACCCGGHVSLLPCSHLSWLAGAGPHWLNLLIALHYPHIALLYIFALLGTYTTLRVLGVGSGRGATSLPSLPPSSSNFNCTTYTNMEGRRGGGAGGSGAACLRL